MTLSAAASRRCPSVRSTEGQFPYWLGVDDRLIADEFFRGSYTTGVWLKGEFHDQAQVHGDDRQQPEHARRQRGAARQQVGHAVVHAAVAAHHRRVRPLRDLRRLRLPREGRDAARRHYTHSLEDKQSQPGTKASRTARSGSPTAASSSRRTSSARASPSTRWTTRWRASTRAQVQGPVARGRVLLALAERLRRRQHRRHRRHQRPRLPAAGLGDGRAEDRSRSTSAARRSSATTATPRRCAAARTGTR